MFGYSKGDLDYPGSGKGEVDSRTLGIYGAYVRPDGFYLDAVLKYQWMENEFEVMDSSVGTVRGDGVNTGGFDWSVEVGQRLRFNSRSKEGWYAEPQLQFSYQRQDGGTFRASNGTVIGVEAFNSLLGRVGVALGYETERSNFYAKVSKVKEFDGDLNIVAGNSGISESFGSSWWTYGIGATSRINERNSFYFDVERSSGGTFRQPWKVNGGWRVSF